MYKPPIYRSPADGAGNGSDIAKKAYSTASRIVISLALEDRSFLRKAEIQTKGTRKELDLGEKILDMIGRADTISSEIDFLIGQMRKAKINPEYEKLFSIAIEYCKNRASENEKKDDKKSWLSAGVPHDEAVFLGGVSGGAFNSDDYEER